jgi:hypothetical protein
MSILNAVTAGAGGVALTGDTTGNLVIQSAGTNVATFTTGGNLTFSVANAGIQFNKSGGLTNTVFNDYEEGTFTPSITSGLSGITYVSQLGNYTKIGNIVVYEIVINISSSTQTAGLLTVGGLPFTSSASSQNGGGMFVYVNNNVVFSTSTNLPVLYTPQSSTQIQFYLTTGSNFVGNVNLAGSAPAFYITGHYPV